MQAQIAFFDPTFGTGGKVILSGGGAFKAIALQTDEKSIVGGGMVDGKIVRFNHNGAIDSSFGINGFYNTPTLPISLTDLAIQPDGKILAIGRNFPSTGNTDFVAFRVESSGIADASFGTSGMVLVDYAGYNDYGYSVAVQSDNKILLAGQFNSNQTGIVRLHPQGIIDSSFGTNGFVLSGYDDAYYIAVTPDGKIVLGGTSSAAHDYTIAAMRFLADGTPDTSFNHTGVVYTAAGDFRSNHGTSVKVQPDGKILVAGSGSYGGETGNFVAVRYNTDGTLDNSFGSAGIANIDFAGKNDYANAMALAPDGRIILAGSTGDDTYKKVAIACLQSDGTLDAAWGDFGRIVSAWQDTFDVPQDIALQSDGKTIVAGLSYPELIGSAQQPAIARYTSLPSGVGNINLQQAILLYPNPAKEKLYIKGEGKVVSCAAYSVTGQRLEPAIEADQSINISKWADGMYVFCIVLENGTSSIEKMVLKNK